MFGKKSINFYINDIAVKRDGKKLSTAEIIKGVRTKCGFTKISEDFFKELEKYISEDCFKELEKYLDLKSQKDTSNKKKKKDNYSGASFAKLSSN